MTDRNIPMNPSTWYAMCPSMGHCAIILASCVMVDEAVKRNDLNMPVLSSNVRFFVVRHETLAIKS